MTLSDITVVVDPVDGDVIYIGSCQVRDLARFLENVRATKRALDEQQRAVSLKLLEILDARASWTLRAEEYEIKAPSPTGVTYSASRLWEELHRLVDDGSLSEDLAEAACERVYAYSAKPSGINRLKKLGGVAQQVVLGCAVPVDPDSRYVSVKRKGMVE